MKPIKECSASLLIVLILIFAAATAQAKKPDNPGGGHGGDDHGDPPARYCAELTSGGFDFDRRTLTRNNRGNDYNSPDELDMFRPDVLGDHSQAAWDSVFLTCPALEADLVTISGLHVSDNWSITNSGGQEAGEIGSQVVVSLRNAYTYEKPDIELDLHLVGTLPYPGFPTADTDHTLVDIVLTDFWFYVHARGTDSCRVRTAFDSGAQSMLTMAWGPC